MLAIGDKLHYDFGSSASRFGLEYRWRRPKMLDSKKRMSQAYSDLKSALEKGKGDPSTVFQSFEQASREFLKETKKVPQAVGEDFMRQAARIGDKIKKGDLRGAFEEYEGLKERKKSCHQQYKG
jgi:XXXCH domain-containing protein